MFLMFASIDGRHSIVSNKRWVSTMNTFATSLNGNRPRFYIESRYGSDIVKLFFNTNLLFNTHSILFKNICLHCYNFNSAKGACKFGKLWAFGKMIMLKKVVVEDLIFDTALKYLELFDKISNKLINLFADNIKIHMNYKDRVKRIVKNQDNVNACLYLFYQNIFHALAVPYDTICSNCFSSDHKHVKLMLDF